MVALSQGRLHIFSRAASGRSSSAGVTRNLLCGSTWARSSLRDRPARRTRRGRQLNVSSLSGRYHRGRLAHHDSCDESINVSSLKAQVSSDDPKQVRRKRWRIAFQHCFLLLPFEFALQESALAPQGISSNLHRTRSTHVTDQPGADRSRSSTL